MKVGLLIRPQKTYLLKTGLKFLFIPLLIAVSVGLFGFKSISQNHRHQPDILSYAGYPFDVQSFLNQENNQSANPEELIKSNLLPDSTKKAKADSVKKALADSLQKKNLLQADLNKTADLKTDTTKKAAADTTKKKTQKTDLNKIVLAESDTTKKAAADTTKKKTQKTDLNKIVLAESDTTKKVVADTTKKNDQKTELNKLAAAATDTTKKDTISPDVKYLLHLRQITPDLELSPKYKSGLYDPFQGRTQRTTKLDLSGKNMVITETVAGHQMKPVVRIPVYEYLSLKKDDWVKEAWQKPLRLYESKTAKSEAKGLLGDFTKVEIPVRSAFLSSIFGEPKIQLEVNGNVKVHAGWRNETTEGFTLALQGNSRNEPDFSQEIQIGLKGKIGDKLDITADWGTKRNFQYENILKIKYTGYDDEIVQSVEAGNVSMQTSSLIGGSEALFGVKANFQIGPLKLQALASQKRSQSEQKTVSSGAQVSKFIKHAWEYSTNHYFIDTIYAEGTIFKDYYSNSTPQTDASVYVSDIEVWKTTTGVIKLGQERRANAYLNLPALDAQSVNYNIALRDSTLQSAAGSIVGNQRFVKLERDVDYSFNEWTGVISFKTLINESEGVAVAYKSQRGNFGEMASSSTESSILVLKLVKPPNLQPSFAKAWKLQLKNIYSLGGKKIKKEGFKLYLKYQVEGVELQDNINGLKLLKAFGFDKVDASGNASETGDGEFDWNSGVTILPETGEIIFPYLHPFTEDLPSPLHADEKYWYDKLYIETPSMARLQTVKDKFVITGEYSAASSSTISIFNAVENSVKVNLDGIPLIPGADFTVEYMGPIAELIIRNPRALVAGANLVINYEQNDMVNLASKTLLGLRGLIDITKDTRLGFTAMNLNQQTLSDKVTIGQEPMSNSMYGLDFNGSYNLPFLTKALNSIFPTNEMSKLILGGEFAYVDPDPNTKKSTIDLDESKSIAYIDDFEGSRKVIPIGANYGGWKDISFPRIAIGDGKISEDKMPYKAKVNWFNDINLNVTVESLYGSERAKSVSREDQRIIAMDFWYKPKENGYYNRRPNLDGNLNNWGGIMRSLSSTANNLIEENIQYIEFWFQIVGAPIGAKLYIDLGQISEDVIPNNKLDTEDKNQNDAYDSGEDIGLDGKTDTDEKNDTTLEGVSDPSGDNYNATVPGYKNINGTEGNAVSTDMGRLPDSEDLNRNWFLDNVDNFFRYEMPIDTTSLVNPFIQGGKGTQGWYLVRIPLNKYSQTKGTPDLRIAETIRFFVHGVSEDIRLRFAEVNLVGNQWRKLPSKTAPNPEKDEVMLVQTISIDDNKDYSSPRGLQQEIDRTKTDRTVYKNEQSLNLVINNLQPGDSREIIKDYSRGLDIFNYKEIKMYVHGDELPSVSSVSYGRAVNGKIASDSIYNAQIYFRFGADTLNFYEYRMPVEPGWKDMAVLFKDLTTIKQTRTRTDTLVQQDVPTRPGHFYGIKGNPSLTSIKFFIVGVVNPKKDGLSDRPVSGSVWINELRVLDADASPGWSYMGSASFKMADIFLFNFNIQNKNPYFHRISDRFGNRNDEKSWSLSAEVDLMKFIPFNLPGSNLRLTYTKSESVNKPLYLFGTDIKISEAAAKLQSQLINEGIYTEEYIKSKIDSINTVSQTTTVTETFSLPSIAIRAPSDNWINRDIVNGLTFGFNYTKQTGKSPQTVATNSWQWDANARYQLDLSRKGLSFAIADIPIVGEAVKWSYDYQGVRIHFFPQTFSFGLSAKRQYKYDLSRRMNAYGSTKTDTSTIKPNIFRDFTTTRYMEFIWMMTEGAFINLTTKYNLDISSSNSYLLADSSNNSRPEKDIWNDVFKHGLFGKDYAVQQNLEFRANPRLPAIWDLNKFIQLSSSYSVKYTWKNDFQQKELGRSALYESTLRFSTSIRWKAFTAPLFAKTEQDNTQMEEVPTEMPETRRGRGKGEREGEKEGEVKEGDVKEKDLKQEAVLNDSAKVNRELALKNENAPALEKDTAAVGKNVIGKTAGPEKPSTLTAVLTELKNFAKFAFFDYEKFDFAIEFQNSLGGGALLGEGTGFSNFWGLTQKADYGPSRLFMLGLSNDLGPRYGQANTSISDNYTQKSKIDFKTNKTLWEGAELIINWSVNWGLNKSTQMKVDANGDLIVTNANATGTIERTFFSMPPVLMFSTIFGSGIKKVNEIYGGREDGNLSDAFIQGFESMPLLSKLPFFKDVMKYIPRPNWSFTWNGLEKFPIFNLAKRASLIHTYMSNYREGWKITPEGKTEIQQQSIDFGFSPLIGLNLSFEQILGGTLTTSVKYNTKSVYTFSAGTATKNITLGLQNDMDLSATFLKSGFEIPLFGVALKNDIEFSISFTTGRSSNIIYKMDKFREDGEPVDGTIRTKISPRIKYSMSQKVNISIFYERTTVKPEGASRTPAITTNLAGIDVEIRIGN